MLQYQGAFRIFGKLKSAGMVRLMKYLCFLLLAIMIGGGVAGQGIITTIAGNGISQYIGDGSPATNFSLGGPAGICLDKANNLYIANLYTARVSKLAHDTLSTIVDTSGNSGYTGNGGMADSATVANPIGVCIDTSGNLYITDVYYDVVRKVNVEGIISTICGSGLGSFAGDGGPATAAHIETPHGACTDRKGNLYVADYGNHRIRKMSLSTGIINTCAGTGLSGYSGDNASAINAQLSFPSSVCTDIAGNLYFSEHGNHCIRKVDANTGIITTVAGNGSQDYTGDGGLAINAALNQPNGVFVDKNGYIYISDFGNNVIRAVTPQGIISTVAGSGEYGSFGNYGDGGLADTAKFQGPTAVCVDNAGYIYIADGDNSVIRKVSPIKFPNAGVQQLNGPSFNIYPNPAPGGKFTINLARPQADAVVTLVNTIGQCVYKNTITGSQAAVDLTNNAPGMYYVQVVSAEGKITRKVVVE